MTEKFLNNYEWAMEKLAEDAAVKRLAWPESQQLVSTFLVSSEQAEGLEEAFKEAEEQGLLSLEQHMVARQFEEAISLVDTDDFDQTIPRWTATQDDVEAKDWFALDEGRGEDE